MPIHKGEEWGVPAAGPPDFTVYGTDSDLAASALEHPGAVHRYRPTASDIAATVGLNPSQDPATELPMDALRWGDSLVVNMVVLGTPPHRLTRWTRSSQFTVAIDGKEWFSGPATTVVVANGQFFHGRDLVPRGHPGDGRAEVQVWALEPRERAEATARLKAGAHLPHPRIKERTGHRIEVRSARKVPIEADLLRGRSDHIELEVVPSAYRLLV